MRRIVLFLSGLAMCLGGCQGGEDAGQGRTLLTRVAEKAGAMMQPRRRFGGITAPIPPSGATVALPPVMGPDDPSRPLIVIDPGHGGHDPGAVSGLTGHAEKDVTLTLARALRDRLAAKGRVRVAMTRDDDRFLALEERFDVARRLGADLFISLHADAADNDGAQGATVYTLSETASDREAARLAARENGANIINGVNIGDENGAVTSILIDLSQREAMARSVEFADLLHREAGRVAPFRNPYHRFASLVVLKAPDIPSVLLEAGYLTSAQDAARLASEKARAEMADGISRAVEIYFARQTALPRG